MDFSKCGRRFKVCETMHLYITAVSHANQHYFVHYQEPLTAVIGESKYYYKWITIINYAVLKTLARFLYMYTYRRFLKHWRNHGRGEPAAHPGLGPLSPCPPSGVDWLVRFKYWSIWMSVRINTWRVFTKINVLSVKYNENNYYVV